MISDQSNNIITNFPTVVYGGNNSGDHLSIFTKNYNDNSYIVNVTLTAKHPNYMGIL